jgi:predicted regulator of Ras-like GTPase activity (Roadblock/LC7/MglB family)
LFKETLARVVSRVPEAQVVMIMATDGIPVEKVAVTHSPDLEAVAAEYTTLLRASVSAAADNDLGDFHELAVVTEKLTALLVAITSDYVLFAALRPDAVLGRARYALRLAAMALRSEFQ